MLGLLALGRFFAMPPGLRGFLNTPRLQAVRQQLRGAGLFLHSFPAWFVGIAFPHRHRRAGAGGDHVDRRGESLHAQYSPRVHQQEPTTSRKRRCKWVSLVVKLGALVFIIFVPTQYAIQLQLLGGIGSSRRCRR